MKKTLYLLAAIALIGALFSLSIYSSAQAEESEADPNPDLIALGELLFLDTDLSANGTQSCATCHGPEVGFTGPDQAVNISAVIYEGAIPHRFGNRKPPASAYTGDSPVLYHNGEEWVGGMFWDGRATGAVLGDPLAEQAQGPFLNPLEQAMPNAKVLCIRVRTADYAELFKTVWGADSLNCANNDAGVYEYVARSIAAYERSAKVNPFTSKFDQFWRNANDAGLDVTEIMCGTGGSGMGGSGMGGGGMGRGGMGGGGMGGAMGCPGGGVTGWQSYRKLGLTDAELQGLAVFNDPGQANCAECHSLAPGTEGYPLFTNFTYDNIGMPKNPDNPFYTMPPTRNPDGADWIDYGLGGYLKSAGYDPTVYEPEMGKFKVPSLRNVDLRPSEDFVKAYGHNGYFKSLEEIVFFYHWRAMMDNGCMEGGGMGGGCARMATMFPPPEVDENRPPMGMFPMPQVGNIVAFLKTLSDGYTP